MSKLIELFGWYGMAAILFAYALVSFSVVPATSPIYQILNITGSLGIITVSFHKKDYQPGILNIIWILIALVAMAKTLL